MAASNSHRVRNLYLGSRIFDVVAPSTVAVGVCYRRSDRPLFPVSGSTRCRRTGFAGKRTETSVVAAGTSRARTISISEINAVEVCARYRRFTAFTANRPVQLVGKHAELVPQRIF